MKNRKVLSFLITILSAFLIVLSVVVFRTVTYKTPSAVDTTKVSLAPAPAIDITKAAQHLSEAVRFKTVSHQDPSQDDHTQWEQLHKWLQLTYPKAHALMKREVVAERALVYTWNGTDQSLEPIILMAHQDVVPVSEGTEKDWRHPPFSGEIAEGSVWGRGSIDDKGSLVSLFEAVETLVAKGFSPKRTIIIISGCDEEVESKGAEAAATLLKSRNVKAEFLVDEGLEILTDYPLTNKPVALIGVSEKGFGTLQLSAHAEGGHSSLPPKHTAVVTLAQALIALNNSQFPLQLDGPTADMLGVLAPECSPMIKMAVANEWLFSPLVLDNISATPAGAAMLHTTIAPTMLNGSPKENVLPATATAIVNFRIDPRDNTNKVLAHTQAALKGLAVEVSWLHPPHEPTAASSTRSRAWHILYSLASDISQAPVAPALFIGGTDSHRLTGVARDIYLFQPYRTSLADLKMIHGTNEHMTLENLSQSVSFYLRLIASAAI